MASDLVDVRNRLIREWEAIPDKPPLDQIDLLCERSAKLVTLIGWIDRNPAASRTAYRAELSRVQSTQHWTERREDAGEESEDAA